MPAGEWERVTRQDSSATEGPDTSAAIEAIIDDDPDRQARLAAVEEAMTRITRVINGRAADRIRMERSGIAVTKPLMAMLRALHDHGPMRVLELGALNHMDKGYVSRAWRSLEGKGFVHVVGDDNARATVIALTDLGRASYLEWRRVNAAIVAETFAHWDGADLDLLHELLERVLKGMAEVRR
jgi:DNA-binding MarR family transcriptional regulator